MPEPMSSEPLPAESQTGKATTIRTAVRARVLPMPVAEPSATERIRKRLQISARRAAGAYREMLHEIGSWLERARIRTRYVVDEHPLQVVGAIAVTAFALGIALRIRRTRHE
jgi:hypothetical protein